MRGYLARRRPRQRQRRGRGRYLEKDRRDRGIREAYARYQADVTRVARDLATFRLATETPYNGFPSKWNRARASPAARVTNHRGYDASRRFSAQGSRFGNLSHPSQEYVSPLRFLSMPRGTGQVVCDRYYFKQ